MLTLGLAAALSLGLTDASTLNSQNSEAHVAGAKSVERIVVAQASPASGSVVDFVSEPTTQRNELTETPPLAPPVSDEQNRLEEIDLSGLVFPELSDDELVSKLETYLADLKTLNGNFLQVAPSGAVSEGEFYLRRPGLLRFEYAEPNPLLIVANGGIVYVRDDALETTDSYPVGQTPLKFLLRKKIDLEDAQVVAVDRGVDTFAVTFASDEDETEGELTIIVNAPEIELARWVVRDLQNGVTEVSLSNVKTGEKLANRLFRAPEAGGEFLKN